MTYSKFPLLKLPLFAFINVAEIWNPFELYNFSQISKRSKYIAKRMSKKPTTVGLDLFYGPYVSLRFPNGGSEEWRFRPDEKHTQKGCYLKGFMQMGCFQEYRFHCDHLVPSLLRLLENILYVFNSELHEVESRLKNDEFDSIMNGFICSLPQKSIPFVKLYIKDDEQLYQVLQFFKSFMKQVDRAYLMCSFSSEVDSEISKRFRKKSEICNIHELRINLNLKTNSMNVNTLTRINYRTTDVCRSAWTNRDLNFFLKSWASGNANSRMEYANLNITKVIDLRIVLNGLSPELRDPRTTKRKFTRDGKTYSVFGGIDIKRNDGKVATIQWIRHAMKGDIDSVPQEWINEFEDEKLINTPPLFEERQDFRMQWGKSKFVIPKWYRESLYIIVW